MSDVECPYCGAEQDINHDDGYGYCEDETYQQECHSCDKTFVFTTSIHFYYNTQKADCLNGANHEFKPTLTAPRRYTKMRCSMCDETRPCTPEEMAEVMNNEKTN